MQGIFLLRTNILICTAFSAHSIPELPLKREVFERLYEVRKDVLTPTSWRTEFHNVSHTMGHRANHLACHAYEVPLTSKEQDGKINDTVEYVKSVIKVRAQLS